MSKERKIERESFPFKIITGDPGHAPKPPKPTPSPGKPSKPAPGKKGGVVKGNPSRRGK